MLSKKFAISKLEELHTQWEVLSDKISRFEQRKILETRIEEILRLEDLIREEKEKRQKLEEEMLRLEEKTGSVPYQAMPESDNHEPSSGEIKPPSRISRIFAAKAILSISLIGIAGVIIWFMFSGGSVKNENDQENTEVIIKQEQKPVPSETAPKHGPKTDNLPDQPIASNKNIDSSNAGPEMRTSPDGSITDPVTGMEFVSIPGNCFQMGAPDNDKEREDDEGPIHKVCVDTFLMGIYEVTQEQWIKIMGSNPSEFQKGDTYPVERVSWNNTQEFIKKLNNKTGQQYRLPTEAEWEYACRAGGSGKYCGGNDPDVLGWYKKNNGTGTRPVGKKQANAFGLYDMSGNVWEWCGDWYGQHYDTSGPQNNPTGPVSGLYRVFRGGSWHNTPGHLRAASRYRNSPDYALYSLGFRLVLPTQSDHASPPIPPETSVENKSATNTPFSAPDSQSAKSLRKPVIDPLTGMEFVHVTGDCFQMGSPDNEPGRNDYEVPRHKVCVDDFRMGKYEVTQGQWVKVMGGMRKYQCEYRNGDEYPMEKVSWNDIQKFITELNKQSGRKYRLPTEAEWEYAARAGTTTSRWWGDDISCDRAMYGNCKENGNDSCMEYTRSEEKLIPYSTAPVGSYPPNQFDLYDMLGNVSEFCSNWLGNYPSAPQHNPQGPSKGDRRVFRGGSLNDSGRGIRAAFRYGLPPDERDGGIGFRLVLPVQESSPQRSSSQKSLSGSEKNITEPVTGMEFFSLPSGCFQMGSPETERDRKENEWPAHEVCLDGFQMGKFEVTQGQWKKIMKNNPAHFQDKTNCEGNNCDRYPVESVDWNQIQDFIAALNEKTGKQFRLPSEAEWEYACRADNPGKYCGGSDPASVAWYGINHPHKVGTKEPNEFGLYDMSGNVREWCSDWYQKDYYASRPGKNPTGPTESPGELYESPRVIRGGSWAESQANLRAASRLGRAPYAKEYDLGFRLVLSAHRVPK